MCKQLLPRSLFSQTMSSNLPTPETRPSLQSIINLGALKFLECRPADFLALYWCLFFPNAYRRVPILRLGSRGPGVDARLLRLWTQALAIVRKRPQACASVRGASDLRRTCRRDENRRETQTCRHFLRFVSEKRQQSQGSGESWSRNAELSSLFDSSRVFASQKCQQAQGSGGSWSRNAELSHFWLCVWREERGERRKER